MTDDDTKPPVKFLDRRESTYYRDQLRESRYHALANAEGFEAICFALEGLGRRLAGEQLSLGTYRDFIRWYEQYSPHFTQQMLAEFSHLFGSFTALFEAVLQARNDAMHSGVYARHAAARAVELCLALEEALMNAPTDKSRKRRPDHRKTVADYMVKSAVGIETWQPVALARQLMLTHSFSFLPVLVEKKWKLVSEMSLVIFLRDHPDRDRRLAMSIADAIKAPEGLRLIFATTTCANNAIKDLLESKDAKTRERSLWLVVDDKSQLLGVLSPFELM